MSHLTEETVRQACREFATPFYLYDETGIRGACQAINDAFSWSAKFRNFFAVKALPNPEILKIVRSEGMGLDCSSLTELMLAERVGAQGADIMFSSNDTTAEEFELACRLNAIINLDDISHLSFLEQTVNLPDLLCFRYNPGDMAAGNDIIGQPSQAKFGMPRQDIIKAIKLAQTKGVKRFGLHTMVISNNLEIDKSTRIVELVFELASDIKDKTGVEVEFINLGGGIGIPYKPSDQPFNIKKFGNAVNKLMGTMLFRPRIYMECGRYITGPYGYLISAVQHIKKTYKTFAGLDASMHNLMRPALYGAYHKITVLGKSSNTTIKPVLYDVTGSLCENNDKFAIDRRLPKLEIGDVVVIHDAGAHGHAMGFNYNGKLRSAEVLVKPDGQFKLIRRAETPEDLFATLV